MSFTYFFHRSYHRVGLTVGIHCQRPVPLSLPAIVKSGHAPPVVSSIGAGVIPTIPKPITFELHSAAVEPVGHVVVVLNPLLLSSVVLIVPLVFKHAPNGKQ